MAKSDGFCATNDECRAKIDGLCAKNNDLIGLRRYRSGRLRRSRRPQMLGVGAWFFAKTNEILIKDDGFRIKNGRFCTK